MPSSEKEAEHPRGQRECQETHLSLKNPKRREPVRIPARNTVCMLSFFGSLPHTRSNCRGDKAQMAASTQAEPLGGPG